MAEINRKRAGIGKEVERTVKSVDAMQQAAYNLAMKNNQPSAAVSAGVAIARLYGMDKDNDIGKADKPQELSQSELDDYRRLSNVALAREGA
jgi:hypothetical protein